MLAILKNKPVYKITVTEICNLANINRSTFYAYYYDPYDLFNAMQNDFIELLQNAVSQSIGSKNIIYDFLMTIANNMEASKIFFGPNGDRTFISKIDPFARDKVLYFFKARANLISQAQMDYYYTFIKGGIALIIDEWIENGLQEPPHTVANNILDILHKLVQK